MEFLVFQHVPHEHPGLLKDAAKKQGIGLEVVEFWKSYQIPNVLDYQGLIILGGPMGVYEGKDKFPSKEDEVKAIRSALGKIPMMGFCLGSQLLAYAFGGGVHKNIVDGHHLKEIGYYDVQLTEEGKKDPLLHGFSSPMEVFQWHGDAFELPKDAVLLATNENCPNQAFRYGGSTWAFLFHVEFTPPGVKELIRIDRSWLKTDFDGDPEKIYPDAVKNETLMRAQSDQLVYNFTEIAKRIRG